MVELVKKVIAIMSIPIIEDMEELVELAIDIPDIVLVGDIDIELVDISMADCADRWMRTLTVRGSECAATEE